VPELLDIFRVSDAETCVDTVIARLSDGLSPRTIWTALAITAVELSVRWQQESWGVHELGSLRMATAEWHGWAAGGRPPGPHGATGRDADPAKRGAPR
jgi:hypothetical protein